MKAAKEAGIVSLHTAMTQRRYEEFDTFEVFKTNFERCKKTIAVAERFAQAPDAPGHRKSQGLAFHGASMIPVFTKKYWATFDDSYSPLPGRDLEGWFSCTGMSVVDNTGCQMYEESRYCAR